MKIRKLNLRAHVRNSEPVVNRRKQLENRNKCTDLPKTPIIIVADTVDTNCLQGDTQATFESNLSEAIPNDPRQY